MPGKTTLMEFYEDGKVAGSLDLVGKKVLLIGTTTQPVLIFLDSIAPLIEKRVRQILEERNE